MTLPLEAGQVAPEFELPDSSGQPRRLVDLVATGSRILFFYRGYWSPFCLRQLAQYRNLYSRIRQAGADMIAISVDSPSISDALRRQLRLPFPILCDTQRRVLREWNILNEEERGGIARPSVFIIDPEGVIRFLSVDRNATRVPTTTVVNFLFTGMKTMPSQPRRKKIIPGLVSLCRSIRNSIYFAFRRSHPRRR